ncbi:hypothetical protein CK203_065910 [Vitis vinifera]|uniref:Retrotransposon gag domain-containing protein n=1 Tax=Vitis vinifera TaxID=29760 RepID=A0A438FNX0_VITVI|nr:hypothetical protein CK203_065910 [Vitis vinifera]
MCGGDFMSKNPEEAMDFLSYVADVSRGWDEPTKENYDKKIGGAGTEKVHEVQAVAEAPVQVKLCPNCQSYEHLVEECPAISAEREMFRDQANVVGQFKPNNNALMEILTTQVGGIIQISHGRPEQLTQYQQPDHHLNNLQVLNKQ